MFRSLLAASAIVVACTTTAFAGDYDPMSRPDMVAMGVGLPTLLSASYERRVSPRSALGVHAGLGLLSTVGIYGRYYPVPGNRIDPFVQVNVGWCSKLELHYSPKTYTTGLDVGLRLVSAEGFTVSARTGVIVPFDGDVDMVRPVFSTTSLQVGHSF